MIAKAIGQSLYNQLSTPISRAREKAINKTAKALETEFPSGNFVAMNFRFDSPDVEAELQKQITGRGSPDLRVLKNRMVEELLAGSPGFSSKANALVETFLRYFEEECLAESKLSGLTLASIVREENAATQRVIQEEIWASEERITRRLDEVLAQPRPLSDAEMQRVAEVTSAFEKEFAKPGDAADLKGTQSNAFSRPYFPTGLVDHTIEGEVDTARKSRFFSEFDRVHFAVALARKLMEGELSGGTDATRSRALAWCSRLLSRTKEFDKVEEYLKLAKTLGTGPEVEIAHGFICSQMGDKIGAMGALARLDLPISRSAALMIVAYHEGSLSAVRWLKDAGIQAADLDPDGKYFLLMRHLDLSDWDAALGCLDALTADDLRGAPAIRHLVAVTHLLTSVPTELRTVVLDQPPFEAASFPLASDAPAIEARRVARRHFVEAAQVARQLNCPGMATIDDEYELWLELRDPEKSADGRRRLEAKLHDPKSSLRVVHLALQFGVRLDLEAVEREIDRQVALNGGMTRDAAIARFTLAFTQKTPESVAKYISGHFEELAGHISRKAMQFFQIEMFSRAGLPERADECLERLVEEGISKEEERRLRRLVAEAEGTDPVEARKEQFKDTDSLGDLTSLVEELESRDEWGDVCEYAEILFQRTHSLRDAERLARALSNAQKNDQLLPFLTDNQPLVAQSKNLQMLYCWSLYDEGELLKARTELEKLGEDWDNPNYRSLKTNLGITLGDWNSLSAVVANEYREKARRSAQDLMGAAQLALHLGLPSAKEMVFAAARKADDDAAILANAYVLASSAGWEDDVEVFQWVHRAAELSGTDGPIKKVSLKDILDQKPDWDRRESETWQLLSRGAVPMFVAAQFLNKSLIDLMLFPALANLSENDPRRRGVVAAYSGRRLPRPFNTGGSVGIDATGLLTLGFLGLLDRALDAFGTVRVPHSTLAWLFEENQKAAFHQPSRIRDAHRLRDLLATGALDGLSPNTVPDSDLSAQIGEELALLIAEAERPRETSSLQRIVVRSSPVHRVSTFMNEEADLTQHSAVLSGCQAVVDKLREKGQITADEAKKARAYLKLQEKPWPNQPDIENKAVLYLDDLAATYFLHLGILQKLQLAGFKPVISPRKVFEVDQLIAYERISLSVKETIEHVRFALNARIESGKVRVGKRIRVDEADERSIADHPSIGLIDLSRDCDAIITDDRFFNQHANIDHGSGLTPVFSTVDLIEGLSSLDVEDRSKYRTLLRQAGYFFMPLEDAELARYLEGAIVKDGKVVETAELKAVRENVLRVRMSTWLQIPEEAPWLDALFKTLIRVLKGLWKPDVDLAGVRARCDWIMDQFDVRGWAHTLAGENRDHMVKIGRGLYVLMLLMPLPDSLREVRDEYWNWIEDRILSSVKEQYPDLFSSIVEWQRKYIMDLVNTSLMAEEGTANVAYVRSALTQAALRWIHPLIRRSLIEKPDFREEYGFVADSIISSADSGVSVRRAQLFNAIRAVHSGAVEIKVIDTKRRKWRLGNTAKEGDIPRLVFSRGKQRLVLPDFCALSPDQDIRLRSFRKTVSSVDIPRDARDRWLTILTERALTDDEMNAFHDELRETPTVKAQFIRNEIVRGRSSISSLVPPSRRYFERLIGAYDGSANIREYAAGRGRTLFQELSEWQPREGLLSYLFLSSHSSMTAEIDIGRLDTEDFVRALELLERQGDRMSQLGAIEVGLSVLSSRPEIEPYLARLIGLIRDDDTNRPDSQLKLLSTLFVLVDGELSRTRLLSAEPPFYRRLAALTQAALIQRQTVDYGLNLDSFHDWALSYSGWQFYMQSLADMRTEPRWNPDLASPIQLKEEFLGRIIIAARSVEQNIKGNGLLDSILGHSPGSLSSLVDGFHPFLPGPLEGAEESQNILPAEVAETIQAQLHADEVGPGSFVALVNLALIFRLDADHAELAARILKLGNHRLANIEDRSQIVGILNGLATVAAVTRSHALANELRVLVRRYRHDAQYSLSIMEATRACLVAAASRADMNAWRDFVGDWLSELAFNDLKDNDGEDLHSHIKRLCHAVPELWVSCGRADAALTAHNALLH